MASPDGSGGETILSNRTYDLLAILLTKLEGLEAYETYMEDLEDEDRQLVEQIRRDDERHAQMLRERIEQMVREGGLR
jgi:hypothetical protein